MFFASYQIGVCNELISDFFRDTLIFVDGFKKRRQCFAFGHADFWSPHFKQKYDTRFLTTVPCLMFDAVIENERLPLFPCSRFITDTQGAVFRYDERNMANQARVEQPVVGLDMGAGF